MARHPRPEFPVLSDICRPDCEYVVMMRDERRGKNVRTQATVQSSSETDKLTDHTNSGAQ